MGKAAECLGAILAGGRSRRMGVPKAGIRLWDGRPMLEHVLAPLRAVCGQVVVVGESRGYDVPAGVLRRDDLHPGSGPLAGIEALLSSGLASGYLVAACDQPFLTSELLARLLEGDPQEVRLFRVPGDGFQPFPGYYPDNWGPRVTEALRRGELSLRALIGPARADWPRLSAAEAEGLRSLNRPEDLQACGVMV